MRTEIRFWYRGELRSLGGISPQKTVLRWLRDDARAWGTKEGCAEGDCGACTVAVACLDAAAVGGVRLRAVNSCLLLLPALDGKALFTVEDLAGSDSLHPVQKALVEGHGSQCGFCTPGFAMSLWADYQERPSPPDRAALISVLAGNLCRCTGYRPILDAALAAWNSPRPAFDKDGLRKQLEDMAGLEPLAYEHEGQTWRAPSSLDELAALAHDQPSARLVAGATDIGLWVTKGLQNLGNLISTASVRELHRVEKNGDLLLGSALPLTDAFAALVERYPCLADWAERFASPPVRNAGTLGGNIANASPIGDSAPVLLALGASVLLRSGTQIRELPLAEFFLSYQKTARAAGEVLTAVRVPKTPSKEVFRVWKVSKRHDQDISSVCAAFWLERDELGLVTEVRLAFGGMAAVPQRASRAESALKGRVFDEQALERARHELMSDFSPLTDGRASSGYRRAVAANLLSRFYAEVEGAGV